MEQELSPQQAQDTTKATLPNTEALQGKEPWIKRILNRVRKVFLNVTEPPPKESPRKKTDRHRAVGGGVKVVDCLMSGLAVFGTKCSSLLQFDERKEEEAIKHNLQTLYQVQQVPCDTYLREKLDQVDPKEVRPVFKSVFSMIQRQKALEKYLFLEEGYCVAIDGSGHYSSSKIKCPSCCSKQHSNGTVSYYHQVFQGAIVHPEMRTVIPFCPEPILNGDGAEKNDCELNAAKRFIADLRREHPHLKIVITADAIGANGPYIKAILDASMSYIIVVTPTGNKSLYEFAKNPETYEFTKDDITHVFRFVNDVPLNDSHPDLLVNFFEYEERNLKTGVTKSWGWATNIKITKNNFFKLMRAGRAKWKIENETFNTLKNQGYNLEHNYGHGQKHLCTIFMMLMVLAFFIDQVQELLCSYFQIALKKEGRRKRLWEKVSGLFMSYLIMSWEDLYLAIGWKHRASPLIYDTS